MNADTIPDDPLARDILNALVDSRAGYNYYDDTRLLLPIIERHSRACISTLEGRLAELESDNARLRAREDEALAVGVNDMLRAGEQHEALEARIAELTRERDEARGLALMCAASEGKRRAERDEAVGLLERWMQFGRERWHDHATTKLVADSMALLARRAPAPEKP